MMLKGVMTFVCGQWFRLLLYITDIVIYVVMRNDIPESCALRCDEGTFFSLVFSLSYVLVLSLFCEYTYYIYLIMLVLSEVSENRVGLVARKKEISTLKFESFL